MNASNMPFVVDANGKGHNTRIDYRFTVKGKSVKGSVVVEGNFSDEDIQILRENLDNGTSFDPQKLGLPDLFAKMPANWNGDEVMHDIDRIVKTDAEYDDEAPSTDQLISLVDVSSVPHTWSTEKSLAM